MSKTVNPNTVLDTMLTEAAGRGLLQLNVDAETLDGRRIQVEGRSLINFGSCSYLGLEMDPRLKLGAIDATIRYGTQFSSSRTYMSAPPYRELEARLETLFGAPTLVTATTGLGHLAALPVLVEEGDAVILDQQVHATVHQAVDVLRSKRVHVELIRHSRMDDLEAKLADLAPRHRRVWYMLDGVYSMYGDLAPFDQLAELLDRHEQLHLYVDDAHGMSWAGQHGRGLALTRMPLRERMVLATSLNKAFAAAGGAIVVPDAELARKLRTCGRTLIFSGPIQPPMLGAGLASAAIHLSDELPDLQARLRERVTRCHQGLLAHGLPVLSDAVAPIHFVAMGLPRVAYRMAERLMADGYYVNVAIFPAVPMRRAGIRFTTTVHQTLADIDGLVDALARHYPEVLALEESSEAEVRRTFRLAPAATPAPAAAASPRRVTLDVRPALALTHHRTIDALDAAEWDRLMGAAGTFTAEGLRSLEAAFRGNGTPENDWGFHYFVVRDGDGAPVLATFFTDAIWKDDMLAAADLSAAVEAKRKEDPYFLTSRLFAMGSLLTEGDHLWLDRAKDWRGAMKLMLAAAAAEQERCGATGLVLRDLRTDDAELEAYLREQGLLRFAELDSLVIDVDWTDDADWLARLSQKARKHQRVKVLPFDGHYDVEVIGGAHGRAPTPAEVAHFHRLYQNVKARNLGLNTFELPPTLFGTLAASPAWELVLLKLRPEHGGGPDVPPVGVSASFVGHPDTYVPLIFGLDYAYVETHGAYRQLFRQMLFRAKAHGAKRLLCGMEATFEKTRFGARVERRAVYYQTSDHFQLDLLAQVQAAAGAAR